MFGQLSNRESLRDVVLATQAHASKAYHLGFGKAATRSNLSKANNTRDYRIFEEFAYRVVAEAQYCRATDIFKLGGKVDAFDSTTIDLCLNVFEWALFRKKKGGVKVHTLYDIETQIPTFFHVTPAKLHDTQAMEYRTVLQVAEAAPQDKKVLGRVRKRCQNPNLCGHYTYCMMAIVQKKMRIKRSIYEMLQIASISLTDTTVLKDLFEIPNHNIVKERNGSEEPTFPPPKKKVVIQLR